MQEIVTSWKKTVPEWTTPEILSRIAPIRFQNINMKGKDLSEDLGHASTATTDKVYVQIENKKRAKSGKKQEGALAVYNNIVCPTLFV